MDDDIFPRISSAKTAKEAWEIIKHEYFGDKKMSGIINLMKSYGEIISNERVVSKVLRSLNSDYNHVVVAIEESKDMSTYTFDELMCFLLAHEVRLTKNEDVKEEEKAFQVKEADCWSKQRNELRSEQRQANFTEKVDGNNTESKLFVAHLPSSHTQKRNSVWSLENGCSNHMSGSKELFKDLDESKKGVVRLGDDKQIQVNGIGTIGIKTAQGDVKLLDDMQFVPNLAHNLLSIGQLMSSGYKIEFDNDVCKVIDKKSVIKGKTESELWHLRYGHLNDLYNSCSFALYVSDPTSFEEADAIFRSGKKL
uniref:Retrovirus-related Pol polyprotein from transposon TNT 1-94-like beta-barrel domain-containing protein n=1 Tax=Chenopodium quinoa TaxID=63459 RepID=A0A803N307_CHEQI